MEHSWSLLCPCALSAMVSWEREKQVDEGENNWPESCLSFVPLLLWTSTLLITITKVEEGGRRQKKERERVCISVLG